MKKALISITFCIVLFLQTPKNPNAGEYDCHPDCEVYCSQYCSSPEYKEGCKQTYEFLRDISNLTGSIPPNEDEFMEECLQGCSENCMADCLECKKDDDKIGCFVSVCE